MLDLKHGCLGDDAGAVFAQQPFGTTLVWAHRDVASACLAPARLLRCALRCIAHHHDIAAAKHHPREVALVHLGNILVLMAEIGTCDESDVAPIDPRAWELTGLSADCIETAVQVAQDEIVEVERLFMDRT